MTMNKFECMNVVNVSTLRPEDKTLLNELILRADESGECFPSVERLCQVRGIKYEKNFKGVDVYLPGLVTKVKRGRRNYYFLDVKAIMALPANEVTIKHTPALEGVSDTPAVEADTPSVADNTPAVAADTPAVEGANSSIDNTKDSSIDSTKDSSIDSTSSDSASAPSPVLSPSNTKKIGVPNLPLGNAEQTAVGVNSSSVIPLLQKGYQRETDEDWQWRLACLREERQNNREPLNIMEGLEV